jgi:hypothetical protein
MVEQDEWHVLVGVKLDEWEFESSSLRRRQP